VWRLPGSVSLYTYDVPLGTRQLDAIAGPSQRSMF
jgi:hypothetical protein